MHGDNGVVPERALSVADSGKVEKAVLALGEGLDRERLSHLFGNEVMAEAVQRFDRAVISDAIA